MEEDGVCMEDWNTYARKGRQLPHDPTTLICVQPLYVVTSRSLVPLITTRRKVLVSIII